MECKARTIGVSVLYVFKSVQDLDCRFSISLTKELSNTISGASRVACEVIKPALTGPKGDKARSLSCAVSETSVSVTDSECFVTFLFIHCRLRFVN